ncbi:MAG: undecaprenyldiphospho-muramoylpentapeptide beta-N-acetylglucosaminyltransferase [Treponema sp.]|nr:undecaprenyldiphospho-muramoylpentapeptide beta-N-acetylglucosaminyltransferase [Treponema sp.]
MVSIAFTGGGTGGHVYPGLAVALRLKELIPLRLFWIGSSKGMERAIVEKAGMEFFGVPSGKLRRYVSPRNVFDVFNIVAGFFAARRILKREKPALLFSKGGFVSVPPCAAAASLGIPVFTHESDYSPGLATRINSRFAEKIFIPYRESAAFFTGKAREKLSVSGNPIRPQFASADPVKGRAFLGLKDERILLVLGGSLGSLEINERVRAALPELTRHYTVVHQTGEKNAASPDASSAVQHYKPYAYFGDEIPHIIAAAELVLCRSGAGTIWECASLRKPMILVPLRGSGTRGDQVENARLFEQAGAAVCFTDNNNTGGISGLIASLAQDAEKRKRMGEAEIAETNAAAYIAEEIARRIKEKR